MAKVYMTCGKICTGKSAWAQSRRKKHRAVVLSEEELTEICRPGGAPEEEFALRARDYLWRKALEILDTGSDVVLDAGFRTRKERAEAAAFFEAHRYPWEFVYFNPPESERKKLIARRNAEVRSGRLQGREVDEALLREWDARFEAPRPEELRPPREEPPRRTTLEEVGNAVTHGVAALLSIAGLVLMLRKASTGMAVLSAWVYGLCLVLLFLMSCLYHAFRWGTKVKRLWRRFDYSSIYLLIGGTFTPLWLIHWGNRAGVMCCVAQWLIILAGITLVGVFGQNRFKAVHMTLYIVMGWCGLIFLPGLWQRNIPLLLSILGGGLLYTLGIIPFARKASGAHFIWHFFVFFGALVQWLGIYLYVF